MTPQHHDSDMYQDTRRGIPMRRWLCTEPGCPAVISDDTLAAMRDVPDSFLASADYASQVNGIWQSTFVRPAAAAGPGTTGGDT